MEQIECTCEMCAKKYFLSERRAAINRFCSRKCHTTWMGKNFGFIGKHGRVSGSFDDKYLVNKETGCHEWIAAKNKNGYGLTAYKGKSIQAHRLAWTIKFGEIPSGMFVCHKCDNPSCCNPDHLFIGSAYDNCQDMISKGRAFYQKQSVIRGFENTKRSRTNPDGSSNSKLKIKDVIQIKKRLLEGEPHSSIAKSYAVSKSTITSINTGNRWSFVTI